MDKFFKNPNQTDSSSDDDSSIEIDLSSLTCDFLKDDQARFDEVNENKAKAKRMKNKQSKLDLIKDKTTKAVNKEGVKAIDFKKGTLYEKLPDGELNRRANRIRLLNQQTKDRAISNWRQLPKSAKVLPASSKRSEVDEHWVYCRQTHKLRPMDGENYNAYYNAEPAKVKRSDFTTMMIENNNPCIGAFMCAPNVAPLKIHPKTLSCAALDRYDLAAHVDAERLSESPYLEPSRDRNCFQSLQWFIDNFADTMTSSHSLYNAAQRCMRPVYPEKFDRLAMCELTEYILSRGGISSYVFRCEKTDGIARTPRLPWRTRDVLSSGKTPNMHLLFARMIGKEEENLLRIVNAPLKVQKALFFAELRKNEYFNNYWQCYAQKRADVQWLMGELDCRWIYYPSGICIPNIISDYLKFCDPNDDLLVEKSWEFNRMAMEQRFLRTLLDDGSLEWSPEVQNAVVQDLQGKFYDHRQVSVLWRQGKLCDICDLVSSDLPFRITEMRVLQEKILSSNILVGVCKTMEEPDDEDLDYCDDKSDLHAFNPQKYNNQRITVTAAVKGENQAKTVTWLDSIRQSVSHIASGVGDSFTGMEKGGLAQAATDLRGIADKLEGVDKEKLENIIDFMSDPALQAKLNEMPDHLAAIKENSDLVVTMANSIKGLIGDYMKPMLDEQDDLKSFFTNFPWGHTIMCYLLWKDAQSEAAKFIAITSALSAFKGVKLMWVVLGAAVAYITCAGYNYWTKTSDQSMFERVWGYIKNHGVSIGLISAVLAGIVWYLKPAAAIQKEGLRGIATEVRNMGFFTSAATSILNLSGRMYDGLKSVFKWLYKMVTGETYEEPPSDLIKEYRLMMTHVDLMSTETIKLSAMRHESTRNAMLECIKKTDKVLDKYMGIKQRGWSEKMHIALRQKRDKLWENYVSSVRYASGEVTKRMTPFCMMITGDSGSGKSVAMCRIAEDINEMLQTPQRHGQLEWRQLTKAEKFNIKKIYRKERVNVQRRHKKFIAIYGKDCVDKFDTNYVNNLVMVIDDFNATDDPIAAEFLQIGSVFPKSAIKADLPSKGVEFEVKVIICSSNNKRVIAKDVHHPAAVDRRFQLKVLVKLKDEVKATSGGSVIDVVDKSKRDAYITETATQYAQERKITMQEAKEIALKEMCWCTFEVIDAVSCEPVDPKHWLSAVSKQINLDITNPITYNQLRHLTFESYAHFEAEETRACGVDPAAYWNKRIKEAEELLSVFHVDQLAAAKTREQMLAVVEEFGEMEEMARATYDRVNVYREAKDLPAAPAQLPDMTRIKTILEGPDKTAKRSLHYGVNTIQLMETENRAQGGLFVSGDKIGEPSDKQSSFDEYKICISNKCFQDVVGESKIIVPVHIEFARHATVMGSRGFMWYGVDELAYDAVKHEDWFKISALYMMTASVAQRKAIADETFKIDEDMETLTGLDKIYKPIKRTVRKLWKGYMCPITSFLGISDSIKAVSRVIISVALLFMSWQAYRFIGDLFHRPEKTVHIYSNDKNSKPLVAVKSPVAKGVVASGAKMTEDERVYAQNLVSNQNLGTLLRPRTVPPMKEHDEINRGIVNKIRQNTFQCAVVTYSGQTLERAQRLNGIFISGDVMMIPRHSLASVMKQREIYICSENNLWKKYAVGERSWKSTNDVALIRVYGHNYMNSIKQYIPKKLDEVRAVSYGFSVTRKKAEFIETPTSMTYLTEYVPSITNRLRYFEEVIYSDGERGGEMYYFRMPWEVGGSGSPVFMRDGSSPKLFVGIMVGMKDGDACMAPFNYSDIMQGLAYVNPLQVDHKEPLPELNESIYVDPGVVSKTASFEEYHTPVIGIVPKYARAHLESNSVIFPTPLYDYILANYGIDRAPAILSTKDPRWPEVKRHFGVNHFLSASLTKSVQDNCPDWDVKELALAAKSFAEYQAKAMNVRFAPLRTFDFTEAIKGVCGPRMNPNTAPGIPWSYWYPSKSGKSMCFTFDESGELNYVNPEFVMACNELEDSMRRGIIPSICLKEVTKDELRPIEKLHKTRSITIMPCDFTVVFRKYYGDYHERFVMTGNGCYPWLVGINPESDDWKNLYERLSSIDGGDYCFDGDIKNWDGHATFLLALHYTYAVNAVIHTWKCKCIDCTVRIILMIVIFRSPMIAGQWLFARLRGLCSGSPGTADINTGMHALEDYLIFRRIMKRAIAGQLLPYAPCILQELATPEELLHYLPFENMLEVVQTGIYGDDISKSISAIVLPWYNGKTIQEAYAELGKAATSATKSAIVEPYKPISKLSILKRSFRPAGGVVWAPLSRTVLYDMLAYARGRTASEVENQCVINFYNVMREAVQHGKKFYKNFMSEFIPVFQSKGIDVKYVSYQDMLAQMRGAYRSLQPSVTELDNADQFQGKCIPTYNTECNDDEYGFQ